MDTARETLEGRFALLLDWEKRKRREATLTVALFYAFLAAFALPLFASLSTGWAWAAPVAIFAMLAPCLLFTSRWRDRDTVRALAALDRTLRLDERATTAWELMRRNETKGVALLVLRQAADRLKSFDARARFPRSWGRHAYLLPPLAALWLAMLYFDTRVEPQGAVPQQPPPLAQKLREFAHELEKQAQSEDLAKTLETARALEKLAQRAIDAGTADDEFKRELAGMREKMAAERSAAGQAPSRMAESTRELRDLRAELEAARESFTLGDAEAHAWQERLAGLTQLKRQLDRSQGDARELGRGELKALLDKLERNVADELDQRALAEADQFLKELQRGRGEAGEARMRIPGDGKPDGLAEGPPFKIPGSAPGKAPGEKSGAPSLPEFRGARPARVKGEIAEGERSATFFKITPAPGKSKLSQDEVIGSYRRQAEAELDTEKIPAELKSTIRNYFISLEKPK